MKNINLDTSKLNYVVYCRKSSESEDKQIQSLETQLREIKEHVERNGLNVVETIQESKSAFKTGREGFEKMIELISSKKANAIIVVRANRISRNAVDAGRIIQLMDEKKLLYIRTPNSTCYTGHSTDKMMIALELIFSKKDSDEKGEMVKEGQRTKALNGYPHGVAALGFLNDQTEEKGNRKWIVDKDRFGLLKIIFDRYLTGLYSASNVYKYSVEELKLTTVRRKRIGGGPIMPSRINYILKDPIYAGFFYYDGVRYELNKKLPRIITEDQHNKIKVMLSKAHTPKTGSHESTYSGKILSPEGDFIGQDVKFQLICDCKYKFANLNRNECPRCGLEISKMNNSKRLKYVYYYNVKKKKSHIPYKTIQESQIDKAMINYVDNHLQFSDYLVDWSKKYILELKENEIRDNLIISKNKETRKKDYADKKAKLRNMLRDEKISYEEYEEDLKRLEVEYFDVDEKRDSVDWYSRLIEIVDITKKISSIIKSDDVQAKRNIISKIGSNLTWDDENLNIYNDIAIEKLVEGIKRVKQINPEFEPKNYVVNKGGKEKTPLENEVFSTLLPG